MSGSDSDGGGIIDTLLSAFGGLIDTVVTVFEAFIATPQEIVDTVTDAEDIGGLVGRLLEQSQPADEAAEAIVDVAEELVLTPLSETGKITPGNVESLTDDLEGNAAAVLFGFIALTLTVEASSGGQVDEIPAEIFAAVSAIGFEDVTGREIDARLQEGVDPALKQKVHADHRSKQADFQDFVTVNLRTKGFETDIETRSAVPEEPLGGLLEDEDIGWLNDPDTYGVVSQQDSVFELASLAVSEPEEIIEEPIQYGVPVPKSQVQLLNELQGFPEGVKSVFQQVIESPCHGQRH